MTQFIHETLKYNDLVFTIDGNSKITANNGTFENPKPNAFSLLNIKDCPGSTSTCRESCYVLNLKKLAPDVYECYNQNSINMKKLLELEDEELDYVIKNLFSLWIRNNCKEFRWHVSGDVFSLEYAQFIRKVCSHSPNVLFWIYTRNFDALHYLVNFDNLIVNVSADRDNITEALRASKIHNLRVCYLTVDGSIPTKLPLNSVILPDYSLRGRNLEDPTDHGWWKALTPDMQKQVCPVDFFGQSEENRCGKCTMCLSKY